MFKLSLSLERWKFNKEYGIWVSNKGRFMNQYKKLIAPKVMDNGYLTVKTMGGSYRYAHRVVMLTWCPTVEAEHLTVDHLNHNKRDNSVANLEWVSLEENIRRANDDFMLPEETLKIDLVVEGKSVETITWDDIKGIKIVATSKNNKAIQTTFGTFVDMVANFEGVKKDAGLKEEMLKVARTLFLSNNSGVKSHKFKIKLSK